MPKATPVPSIVLQRNPDQSYDYACAWVALNDNQADGSDIPGIAQYLSTTLVADLFGKSTDQVAHYVAAMRRAEDRHEAKGRRRSIAVARTQGPAHPTGGRISILT